MSIKQSALQSLLQKFGWSEETLREMYYARVKREEDERLRCFWEALGEEKEQPYFGAIHASVDRAPEGYVKAIALPTPFPQEQLVCMEEQARRFYRLGYFPEEEQRQFHCERCSDNGTFWRNGKVRQCNCWKKPVKKWLHKFRSHLEEEKKEIKFLSAVPNELGLDQMRATETGDLSQ